MWCEWMKNIPLVYTEEDVKEIKLSLKDRFAIWLLNLGK